MEWAGVTMEELERMTEGQLRRRIGDRVEVEWRLEMESKSTLETYRRYKLQMEEVDYDGGMESVIWFRARTNCLELNGRKRELEQKECLVCGAQVEDLVHFLLQCKPLEQERVNAVELQRPRMLDDEEVVGVFLFGEQKGVGWRRVVLLSMWRRRRRIMEERLE